MMQFDEPLPITKAEKRIRNDQFFSITMTPGNSTQTLVNSTLTEDLYIDKIDVEGDTHAIYELIVNTMKIAQIRTTAAGIIQTFTMPEDYLLLAGTILEVKVTHFGPTNERNFNATLWAHKRKFI